MNVNTEVRIASLRLKNPVLTASGTFGYGDECPDLVDVSKLGGIITKSLSMKPRDGNPPPRIAETASGMLNSIGLANIGVRKFIEFLKSGKMEIKAYPSGNLHAKVYISRFGDDDREKFGNYTIFDLAGRLFLDHPRHHCPGARFAPHRTCTPCPKSTASGKPESLPSWLEPREFQFSDHGPYEFPCSIRTDAVQGLCRRPIPCQGTLLMLTKPLD